MMSGISSFSPPSPLPFLHSSKSLKTSHFNSPLIFLPSNPPNPVLLISNSSSKSLKGFNGRNPLQCSSSSSSSNGPPGPGSGDNESKVVLDAFFLGKAFAEALNERIGSTVGEILSVFGQWQAEQQKQVQDFQEEVVERAKTAKEKAALEVMEDQRLISKASVVTPDVVTPVTPSSLGPKTEDPIQEMLND